MKLLVPVSGSRGSLAAVNYAVAAVRDQRDEVIVLNVQPRLPSYVARFTSRASRDAMRAQRAAIALAAACAVLEASGVRYRKVFETGRIAGTIAEVAARLRADQIVVGTARRAVWWQALFSLVPRIVDLADAPVAVIGVGRSGAFERYGIPACVGLGITALAITAE